MRLRKHIDEVLRKPPYSRCVYPHLFGKVDVKAHLKGRAILRAMPQVLGRPVAFKFIRIFPRVFAIVGFAWGGGL